MKDLSGRVFNRILIVKLSAMGDVVMAAPFARGLRDLYPEARIEWLVEPLSADILRGNPFLDDVLVWKRDKGRGLRGLYGFLGDVGALRRRIHGRYDLAVDLQGLARSAVAMWASGAPVRLGKDDAREGGRVLLTHAWTPETSAFRASEQYTQVLRALGHPNPPVDLEIYPDAANRAKADALLEGMENERGIVSIAMATTRPYKHWTDKAFAETIDGLHDEFGLHAVLHGGPADVAMGERIASMCRAAKPRVVAGRTTLRDAAEIIGRSRLLVSVDTGLLFVGLAMRAPTVALFGPTKSEHLRHEPRVVVLQSAGARSSDGVVRRRDWWDDRSIEQNTPAQVLDAARGLLAGASSKAATG
jgi:heptosyltransferase-1